MYLNANIVYAPGDESNIFENGILKLCIQISTDVLAANIR